MADPLRDLRDQLQTALGAAYPLERELGGGGMSRVFVSRAQVGTTAADAAGRFTLGPADGRNPGPRPVGVPSLPNVVGGMDFQRILLRHGSHWKDPGAGGVEHGEYTHPLQWYAILEATPPLPMANRPIEIFKSMGSLWSRSNYPGPPASSGHTYLWEVLFDCFPATSATSSGTGSRRCASLRAISASRR
ncbi:MAG TPA: LirA/MavJ family T4SS effector [Gemmatirosa sp.]